MAKLKSRKLWLAIIAIAIDIAAFAGGYLDAETAAILVTVTAAVYKIVQGQVDKQEKKDA